MTATLERSPARNQYTETPSQNTAETLPLVGNRYTVTRIQTEFQGFGGRDDIWLAEQPSMPEFIDASIKMQDQESTGLDSVIVPYSGDSMMSRDLEDEFKARNIKVIPVMMAHRSLIRHNYPWKIKNSEPENLVIVGPEHVDAVAEAYSKELTEYAIPESSACGWPAMVAFAGLNKLRRQGKDTGTTAVYGAYRELPTIPPARQYLHRMNQ